MLAIDTNVVVRFVSLDDADQSPRAKALVETNDVFVSLTVILEAGWVLSNRYGYPPAQVVAALNSFLGLPQVSVSEPLVVTRAFEWVTSGLDFADALHLAQAHEVDGFATFDRTLASAAARPGEASIRLL